MADFFFIKIQTAWDDDWCASKDVTQFEHHDKGKKSEMTMESGEPRER